MKNSQISNAVKINLIFVALMSGLTIIFCPVATASPPGWRIIQLTNNNYDDDFPQISGSNVVWAGRVGGVGNDWEILFYNGSTTIPLTNNNYDNYYSQISGSNIVWEGDNEIFFYNGTLPPTQLTNNTYHDYSPQISGSNVVWQGYDGNDDEIFMAVPCQYVLDGDLNDDCIVDFEDYAYAAENWLVDCILQPSNPKCGP